MKVLIIDDDNSILELLAIIIENGFSPSLIAKAMCPQSAIQELDKEHFDLIICDYDMPPHGNGEQVFDYFVSKKIEASFLLFTAKESHLVPLVNSPKFQNMKYSFLQKPSKPKIIKEKISAIINREHATMDNYCSIRIYNFTRFNTTKCDIYIKIGDDKFVKVLNKDDTFEADFIGKYMSKNITHLYITKDSYDQFLVEFGSSNFLLSSETDKATFIETAKKSHQYLAGMINSLGVSQYTIDMATNIAEKTIELTRKDKTLSLLLEKLIKSQSHSYDHTFLVTCLCTHIAKEIGLSEQAIEKLAFSSLVHDIGINKNETCYIHDIVPSKIDTLDFEDQYSIKNHHEVLEKIEHLPDISDDILTIVKFHHIFDDAYPNRDTINLERFNSVVGVFLVAHAFSNELYRADFDMKKVREGLTIVTSIFKTKNFAKIIRALDIIILEKDILN